MVKHVIGFMVIIGLIDILSVMSEPTGRLIIALVIALLVNFYNITHNIKKCNYPDLYKINLIGRSSIIIMVMMIFIWYALDNDLFSFLYSEVDTSDTTLGSTIDKVTFWTKSDDTTGCPNPTSDKWKELSKDEKKRCEEAHRAALDKERREEITDKVYA